MIGVYLYNYTEIKSTAKQLSSERRYNEAYKLLYDNEYNNILQSVCEEASAYYANEGDYEQAYVYAMAAPQTFEEEIVSLAAANVVSDSDEINENAYRVAKVASDDQTFSTIVHSIIDLLIAKEDYTNALRVASELRYINDRERTRTKSSLPRSTTISTAIALSVWSALSMSLKRSTASRSATARSPTR